MSVTVILTQLMLQLSKVDSSTTHVTYTQPKKKPYSVCFFCFFQ